MINFPKFRQRVARVALFLFVSLVGATAFADTSLRLSTSLPGWDKVRSGPIEQSVENLARDYARQLGQFCSLPEVFVRSRSSSIISAESSFTTHLPFNSREEVLLRSSSQRVSVVYPPFGSNALAVMVVIEGSGVALGICGL